MIVELLDITRDTTFVPEFNGNKDLPESEQIHIHYRKPTLELKRRLLKYDMKYINDENGKMRVEAVSLPDRDALLNGMVMSIENCGYLDGDRERSIVNAKELCSGPVEFEPLVTEVYNYFVKILSAKVDEKN